MHCKYNFIAVNFDKTQHGIYMIQKLIISRHAFNYIHVSGFPYEIITSYLKIFNLLWRFLRVLLFLSSVKENHPLLKSWNLFKTGLVYSPMSKVSREVTHSPEIKKHPPMYMAGYCVIWSANSWAYACQPVPSYTIIANN